LKYVLGFDAKYTQKTAKFVKNVISRFFENVLYAEIAYSHITGIHNLTDVK